MTCPSIYTLDLSEFQVFPTLLCKRAKYEQRWRLILWKARLLSQRHRVFKEGFAVLSSFCFYINLSYASTILSKQAKNKNSSSLRHKPWKEIFVLSNGAIDVFATAPATAPESKEQIVWIIFLFPVNPSLKFSISLGVKPDRFRPITCFVLACATISWPRSVFFEAIYYSKRIPSKM